MTTIERPAALSGTSRPAPASSSAGPPRRDSGSYLDARDAAEELAGELAAAGFGGQFVGLRAGRNVVGRPVVRLGSVDPEAARRLADMLRIASTRTLYIIRTDPAGAPVPGDAS